MYRVFKTPADKAISEGEAISLIRKSLADIYKDGDVVEVRALGSDTVSGFHDDLDKAAANIYHLNNDYSLNVYTVLNPIKVDWQTVDNKVYDGWGLKNHLRKQGVDPSTSPRLKVTKTTTKTGKVRKYYSLRTTSQEDILCRRWIPIDIEKRPSEPKTTNTSPNSSDDEKDKALQLAGKVVAFINEHGIPWLFRDSGNGYHVLIKVDLDRSSHSTNLVKAFLVGLQSKFGTDEEHIDVGVYDLQRIMRAAGTVNRRGRGDITLNSKTNRPCRRSQTIGTNINTEGIPDTASVDQLEEIALWDKGTDQDTEDRGPIEIGDIEYSEYGEANTEAQKQSLKGLLKFLHGADIQHTDPVIESSGRIKICVTCPNSHAHTNGSAASATVCFVNTNGSLGFDCKHEHCERTWYWFRNLADAEHTRRTSHPYFRNKQGPNFGFMRQEVAVDRPQAPGLQLESHANKRRQAVTLLRKMTRGQRVRLQDVQAKAEEMEISRRQLKRAHRAAGVKAHWVNGVTWLQRVS